jgi:Metallo-peptidase family M12B Reprolysin-like
MLRRILADSGAQRVEFRLRRRTKIKSTKLSIIPLALLALFSGLLPDQSRAQQTDTSGLWRELTPTPARSQGPNFLPQILRAAPLARPRYREFKLNVSALEKILANVNPPAARPELLVNPSFLPPDPSTGTAVSVPAPDGRILHFNVVDAGVMAPELAAKYPAIRAYRGASVSGEPDANLRLEVTPSGFHAWVHAANGPFNVEPVRRAADYLHSEDRYATFLSADASSEPSQFRCAIETHSTPGAAARPVPVPEVHWGDTYRTYRLAVAATGPYTKVFGGTKAGALDAIVRTIANVNHVYERDLSIHLQLVGAEDLVIFTDPNNDGFTHGNASILIHQSQTTIDKLIGPANYDIGHTFGTDGAGLAQVGGVMQNDLKAQGITGIPNPTGSQFDIDYVAHEMGHQFGANHTFNGADSYCGTQRNATTAYEPGSGSTILGYAGVCQRDDLQKNSDPYFHSISLSEIYAYVSGAGETTRRAATGNLFPVASAGARKVLPISTPFRLTASLSAPAAAAAGWLYVWEEFDLGPPAPLTAPDDGMIPLFRSSGPSSMATRVFGVTEVIDPRNLANTPPRVARSSSFRVTVRRTASVGGTVVSQTLPVLFTAAAGPFTVTRPNGTALHPGANTITWDVANTFAPPVSVTKVKILLSIDGGQTFPTVLAAAADNNGAAAVVLAPAASAIVRIESIGNYFFADSAITPIR